MFCVLCFLSFFFLLLFLILKPLHCERNMKVTMIGNGGTAGDPSDYPGGGGGSGYYVIEQTVEVTRGETVTLQFNKEGSPAVSMVAESTKISVAHGYNGVNHGGNPGPCSSALGGDGGSGGQ